MWVAGLVSPHGSPAEVIVAVMHNQVVAVVSPHLLDELTRVLLRPKLQRWISPVDAVAFVDSLSGHAEMHPDPETVPPRVRDPDDDYLVALADTATAVVVTGDKDLLEADLGPAAITPADLLTRIR